jgi:predicted Fe-S protein YdhL (DUF1289 family)
MAHNPPMETPCVRVCVLDAATGLCSGCGRTLDEIGDWLALSEAERERIMAELPDRMARIKKKR